MIGITILVLGFGDLDRSLSNLGLCGFYLREGFYYCAIVLNEVLKNLAINMIETVKLTVKLSNFYKCL